MTDVNTTEAQDMQAGEEVQAGFDAGAPPSGAATEGVQYEEGEGFSFNMKEETAQTGFPLFKEGTYDAIAEDCQFQISKTSGNPMWAIKWAFEAPDAKGTMKVRKLTSYVIFSAEQRGRAKGTVKRIAPELAELENFDPRALASQIVGKRARVKVNIRKNQNDEDANNIADVLAPASGAGGGFAL